MPSIARTPDDLTPRWCTEMLTDAGHITKTTVTDARLEVVGTGQLGSLVRVKLTYDAPVPGAPESVVVKLASTDDGSRAMGVRTGAYEAEVRFYQRVADTVGMTLPRCDFAAVEERQGWVTLVLEDLSGRTEPGDVLTAGTVDQAAIALGELVELQAPRWNDPSLEAQPWLDHRRTVALFDEVPGQAAAMLSRFGDKLDAEHIALIERAAPMAPRWVRSWRSPRVIQHGDYRLDNMLLATEPEVAPITVVDWQTVKLGLPTMDASYYLGVCLPIEERRRHERDLIAEYHSRLVAAGVDWSWDDCWLEYRTHSIYGFYMALAFGAQVKQTERGDAMFAMATRVYADLALDHDAAELLDH